MTPTDRNKNSSSKSSKASRYAQSIECIKNKRTCDEKEREYWTNKFIMLNQHIVEQEVSNHAFLAEPSILEREDLIAYGYEGLLNVMEKINFDNKQAFSIYMRNKVQYYIRKGIDDNRSSFGLTTPEKEKINHMNRLIVRNKLSYSENQGEVLIPKLHVSKAQFYAMKKFEEMCVYNQQSLDEAIDNLEEDEFIDNELKFIDRGIKPSIEDEVISMCFVDYIIEMTEKVLVNSRVKREAFMRYFGLKGYTPHRVCEISECFKVSQSFASQSKRFSIGAMRRCARTGKIINWYKEDA